MRKVLDGWRKWHSRRHIKTAPRPGMFYLAAYRLIALSVGGEIVKGRAKKGEQELKWPDRDTLKRSVQEKYASFYEEGVLNLRLFFKSLVFSTLKKEAE